MDGGLAQMNELPRDGGAAERPALVRLDNAGLSRNGRWLVRGVDLVVPRGDIVTLIGPNGSGKSTTARMALGLVAPSEGRATRDRTLRVGYVPQKLAIDWTMPLTVRRFMSLTQRLPPRKVEEMLERVGIPALADAQMRTLSGGEFQRALIARAIAGGPDLLVLDEPVQGVDVKGEAALYALIDAIRHELDCGVLMISHDLHVVMASTDTVICLNGHVCCRGTPQDVSRSSAYRDLFGWRPSEGIAVYQHDHDPGHDAAHHPVPAAEAPETAREPAGDETESARA